MEYFAEGKRGKIYIGYIKGKMVAIKKEKRNLNRINNEIKFLKILNEYNIGPRLINYSKDYMIYEFVEGIRILDYLKNVSKREKNRIIKNVLLQCRTLDKLNIDKYEMNNPYKHILIGKQIKMIDFERCKFVEKPKNVTQFCQFIVSKKVGLKVNRNKFIKILKNYKNNQTDTNFEKILNYLKL
ncbi:MAG: hypothetical protein NT139_03075 [Candidatus Woesearchaeota archaeon]|nr:hypothetical protein [Candidatus Woesearchaeota archaeon]